MRVHGLRTGMHRQRWASMVFARTVQLHPRLNGQACNGSSCPIDQHTQATHRHLCASSCAGRVQGIRTVEGVGSPVAKGAVTCGRCHCVGLCPWQPRAVYHPRAAHAASMPHTSVAVCADAPPVVLLGEALAQLILGTTKHIRPLPLTSTHSTPGSVRVSVTTAVFAYAAPA